MARASAISESSTSAAKKSGRHTDGGERHQQREAHRQLQKLAEAGRLRVVKGIDGWPTIPGKYGAIHWIGEGPSLAVYSNHSRLFDRLLATPGVHRHQIGDGEIQPLVEPQALDQVAKLIKARRRRAALSTEEARRRGFKSTVTDTTGAPEPRSCPDAVPDMGSSIQAPGGPVK